jgi:hypothetical protein
MGKMGKWDLPVPVSKLRILIENCQFSRQWTSGLPGRQTKTHFTTRLTCPSRAAGNSENDSAKYENQEASKVMCAGDLQPGNLQQRDERWLSRLIPPPPPQQLVANLLRLAAVIPSFQGVRLYLIPGNLSSSYSGMNRSSTAILGNGLPRDFGVVRRAKPQVAYQSKLSKEDTERVWSVTRRILHKDALVLLIHTTWVRFKFMLLKS